MLAIVERKCWLKEVGDLQDFNIMNAPERTSSFLLDEDIGELKIVYTADTKVRWNDDSGDDNFRKVVETPIDWRSSNSDIFLEY